MIIHTLLLSAWVHAALPIIEDDYTRAVAEAKRAQKPLLIDFWAPWCHACLNLKSYVLTDPAVVALAKDAVFVSIDTEKDANAAVVQRFQPRVWPTLLLVDAGADRVLGRLAAGPTVKELVAFVHSATDAPPALREADELAATGKAAEAMKRYEAVLSAKPDVAVLGRAAYALTMMQAQAGDYGACAQTAATHGPALKTSSYGVALAALHIDCLLSAGKTGDKALDALARAVNDAIASTDLALSVDDKSDLYATLADIAEARKDKKLLRALREERRALLEDAATHAPTPEAARVFDAHRTDVYISLEQYDAAVAMLAASEKVAPGDYNPPARLARVYLAKGDLANAKAAAQRAMTRVYGPRTATVALLAGDIFKKVGDAPGARNAYTQAKTVLTRQPQTPSVSRRVKELEQKIADLGAPRI